MCCVIFYNDYWFKSFVSYICILPYAQTYLIVSTDYIIVCHVLKILNIYISLPRNYNTYRTNSLFSQKLGLPLYLNKEENHISYNLT